jgi:hypothetical protein
MVKMGMGDEDVLKAPLFLLAQDRANGPGIQQQVVVNQKGRRPEARELGSCASQNP